LKLVKSRVARRCEEKSQHRFSGFREREVPGLDATTREGASSEEVLALSPRLRSCVADASEKGAIPASHGICRAERELRKLI
jgi:hypothetical protein